MGIPDDSGDALHQISEGCNQFSVAAARAINIIAQFR